MSLSQAWFLRGSVRYTFPVFLGVLGVNVVAGGGWRYEWLWAMRAPMNTFDLLGTFAAAAVAYDVSAMARPVTRAVGGNTRRAWAPAVALALTQIAALVVAVALVETVAVLMLQPEATGHFDPWVFPEVLAAASATAGLGLLIGYHSSGIAAPLLAAGLTYLLSLVGGAYSMLGLLGVASASSSLVGLHRDSAIAGTAICLNLAVGALTLAAAPYFYADRRRRRALITLTIILTVIFATLNRAQAQRAGEFVPNGRDAVVCAGTNVQMCGPGSLSRYIGDVGFALSDASSRLSGSGLPLATRYTLVLPGEVPVVDGGSAVPVSLAPAQFYGSKNRAVAGILAQPRLCADVVSGGPNTTLILDAQEVLAEWLGDELRGDRAVPAPPSVVQAAEVVATCGAGQS